MIDYHKELVSALGEILPTHYELNLTNKTAPCISYQERDNAAQETGDTLGYSRISYTIKVWACDIATIQKYCREIDNKLRPLGWKRVSANELHDRNSSMIQKIMTYEAIGLEEFI